MSEDGKSRGITSNQQEQQYYGTFQGVANYHPPPPPFPPPQPVVGFPQPVPPSGASPYYHGYQTVPGYAVAEGRPVREPRLPCCGIGLGWFLFISGFFLGAIPWYIGAIIILCVRVDYREKPGYVACTLAAMLAVIAITLGVTKGTHAWPCCLDCTWTSQKLRCGWNPFEEHMRCIS